MEHRVHGEFFSIVNREPGTVNHKNGVEKKIIHS
jgi:hypothetical protein